jgi:hypothetical protein
MYGWAFMLIFLEMRIPGLPLANVDGLYQPPIFTIGLWAYGWSTCSPLFCFIV